MKNEKREFRYLTLELHTNGLNIYLTKEGYEFIENFDASFEDMFDEIRGNSELLFFDDIGEVGLGLTSAPGITDGYYYDDKGNMTNEKDSEVYWYPNYMVSDFMEELEKTGHTFFNKG